MNKAILGIVALGLVGVLYMKYFYVKPCSPVPLEAVQQLQVSCARNLFNDPDFRAKLCGAVNKPFNCDLTLEDKPIALPLLNKAINDCAAAELKQSNSCQDNIKNIVE